MKTRITLTALLFLACTLTGFSQTKLFDFEDGLITTGTWWPGGYSFFAVGLNPESAGINKSTKSINATLKAGTGWNNSYIRFQLPQTAPLSFPRALTSSERYLHFMYRTDNVSTGSKVLSVEKDATWDLGGAQVNKTRFDFTISTPNVWQDIVVDLKPIIDAGTAITYFGISANTCWASNAVDANLSFDEFELNNSPLPRGINMLTDTVMNLFFGNTASYSKWVNTLDLQNAANASSIVDNPFTTQTAVLNSTKIFKFDKAATAAWWQGPRIVFPGILPVANTANPMYLHVMVNIPTMEAGRDFYVVQLCVKDYVQKQIEGGDSQKYWNTDAGNWVDMVMLIDPTILSYVQEFTVRFDVRRDPLTDGLINSPAGTFYMDAAVINSNPDPRLVVTAPTAVNSPKTSNVKIYSTNHNIVVEGNTASIEVYSVVGKLLNKSITTSFKTELPVNQNGMYLVKTTSSNGNVSNTKVLVK